VRRTSRRKGGKTTFQVLSLSRLPLNEQCLRSKKEGSALSNGAVPGEEKKQDDPAWDPTVPGDGTSLSP